MPLFHWKSELLENWRLGDIIVSAESPAEAREIARKRQDRESGLACKTIGYRIECAGIEEWPGVFRQVWFLDAVQVSPDGRRSVSSICSGSREYCQRRLAEIQASGVADA